MKNQDARQEDFHLSGSRKRRRSAIDGRTTRHFGYAMSQSRRAMIECMFGWGKQHGTMRKTMRNLIANNLVRIPKMVAI